MLDALSEAYSTAKALYRRHTALPSLEAACELCKFTIAKCEALMELRDADDSASDSGDDSGDDEGRQRDWTKWLTGKCQGVTRLQLLKELTPKLQLCVQTLQLALVALPLRIDRAALLPRAPFRYVPAAQEQALRLAQQLELGRVRAAGLRVAAGELFRSVRYTGGEGAGGSHRNAGGDDAGVGDDSNSENGDADTRGGAAAELGVVPRWRELLAARLGGVEVRSGTAVPRRRVPH